MVLLWVLDTYTDVHAALSVTGAYAGAMLAYFLVSKYVVFTGAAKPNAPRELAQFVIVVVVNYVLTQMIVLGMRRLTGEVYSGSLVAGAVTVTLSYLIFDRIVFRRTS